MTYGTDSTSSDVLPPDPGHVATKAQVQYPMQLQNRLNFFTSSAVTVINRGYSGDTAKECYERWKTNPTAHVAHIMLGINDAKPANDMPFDKYVAYMEKLIRRYIDWGCGVVIHTTPAQTFNNANLVGPHYTQSLRAIADIYGCPVFDSEEVNQFRMYGGINSDGTHYNKHGYGHFGNAVASFVMAGGWVGMKRGLSSYTNMQSGRSTEGIGFFSKGAVLGTSSATYMTNGSRGEIPAGATGVVSFHFYMDCDIANINIIGRLIGLTIKLSETTEPNKLDVNRHTLKAHHNRRIFETVGGVVATGRSGEGRDTLAGTLVGRGWKTVYVQYDGSHVSDKYCQGFIFDPKDATEATQHNYGSFRKARDEVTVWTQPAHSPFNNAPLPSPTPLTGDIFMPLPDGMYSYVGSTAAHAEYGLVYVTILTGGTSDAANNPNGITKLVLRRTTSLTTLAIDKVYSTSANSIMPIAAGIGSSAYADNVQDPVAVNKASDPVGTGTHGWLWFTFPATSATAFYKIEVRCASFGSQSNWFS